MKVFDRLAKYRSFAPYLVMAFFLLSIVFSAIPATTGTLAGWIICAILGLIFVRVAFPRSYLYGLWLLVIYILSGVGVLFFNGVGLTGGQGIAVGILIEIIAIYILYHLIFQVKGLRDVGEGPYVPLGLWAIAAIVFFLFANGAFASLVTWAKGNGELTGYIALEGLLVFTFMFIMVRAEQCVLFLEEGAKAIRRTRTGVAAAKGRPVTTTWSRGRGARPRKGKKRPRGKKAAPAGGDCPICKGRLRMVERICPECGEVEKTAVCKTSSHIFLPCPSCGKANFHRRYRCKNCNARLKGAILCRECGVESDVEEWRTLKARPGKKKKKRSK